LTSDVELYDKKMLIENLKNKMSFELQKVMINEFFEIIELHAFARKCQYTDQVLRDVKNKSRYREAIEASASGNEKRNLLADQSNTQSGESSRQQTLALAFDQQIRVIIASSQAQTSIFGQINTFICYNCEKSGHMVKHCRSLSTSRIHEIIDEIETEIESEKD
jgi:hypothetical protein